MSNKIKKCLAGKIASVLICLSMVISSVPVSAASWNDGTYEGSGVGYENGIISVKVNVSNGVIQSIETVSKEKQSYWESHDLEGLYDVIKEKNGVDEVDCISGATKSSKGLLDAVEEALDKAGFREGTSPFASGKGTEKKPYMINTSAQLMRFAKSVDEGTNYKGQYIKLGADIELSKDENFNPIGEENGTAGKIFAGVFDGEGHTIKGLTINQTVTVEEAPTVTVSSAWGLFSILDNTAVVKNLKMQDTQINIVNGMNSTKGQTLAGAIAGDSIKAASNSENVSSARIDSCTVIDSKISVTASAAVLNWSAGIIGRAANAVMITNCYSSGEIVSESKGGSQSAYAGGIAGTTGNGVVISNCASAGTILASSPKSTNFGGMAGGIAGMNAGMIYNVYSSADITIGNAGTSGKQWIGTIAGQSTVSGMQKGTTGDYSYKEEGPYRAFGYYASEVSLKEIIYEGETVKSENVISSAQAMGHNTGNKNYDAVFTAEAKTKAEMTEDEFAEVLNKNIKSTLTYLANYKAPELKLREWKTSDGRVIPMGEVWVDGEIDTSIFASGDGTKETPFVIHTKEQFVRFASSLNSKIDYKNIFIELGEDIDISDMEWTPIGGSDYAFDGVFDGKGHTIAGMTIGSKNSPKEIDGQNELYVGLFGIINEHARIRNVILSDVEVYTHSPVSAYVGGLVGRTHSEASGREGSQIDSCVVKGTVSHTADKGNQFAGGIIGYQYKGALINTSYEGKVSCVVKSGDLAEAGGLVALNNRGLVANCFANADIYGSGDRNNGNEGMAVVSNLVAVQAGSLVHSFGAGNTTTKEYSTYAGMVSGWITGVGKTYQNGYFLDSTMIIGEDTTAKQIVNPVEAIGTKVASGVNEEGEIYTGGLADANVGYHKIDFDKAVTELNKISEFPIDIALYGVDKGALKNWKLVDGELGFDSTYATVNYVQPKCEIVPPKEEVMLDGTWYGRDDDKTSVVQITTRNNEITKTTVLSGEGSGEAYGKALEKAKKKASYGDDSGYGKGDAAKFAGGEGTKENPYKIETKEQLCYLAESVNEDESWKGVFFKQTKDIDIRGIDWKPIGLAINAEVKGKKTTVASYPFRGNFDGDNYTIKGLTIGSKEQAADQMTSGLFGFTSGEYTDNTKPTSEKQAVHLSNIKLKDVFIHVNTRYETYCGALLGYGQYGIYLSNCHTSGEIQGATKESFNRAGGLAGSVFRGGIENVSADVKVNAQTETSHVYAGGLFGMTNRVTTVNSYALGDVTGNSENNNKVHIGGLTGQAGAVQLNCYAKGDVVSLKTTSDVGGLNGRSAAISADYNCYYNTDAVQKNGDTVNETNVAVGVNANDKAMVKAEGKSSSELSQKSFADLLNNNQKEIDQLLSDEGEVGKFLAGLSESNFLQVSYYQGGELSKWELLKSGVVGFLEKTNVVVTPPTIPPTKAPSTAVPTATASPTSLPTAKPSNTNQAGKKAVKKTKTVKIPATKKVKGKKRKVTSIAASAYAKDKMITKVIIGKNVKKIGKKAFYGCSNLKTIVIQTKKLTLKSIGAQAFKGIRKDAVIKVPKGMVKKYRKILRKKGLSREAKVVVGK